MFVRAATLPRTCHLRARQPVRCVASTPSNEDDMTGSDLTATPSPASAHLTSNSGPPEPSAITADYEELLAAFDSSVDEIALETENTLAKSTAKSTTDMKPHERQAAAAKEAYLRRLDILSTIPHDLVVEQVRNKCPGCGSMFQSDTPERPGYVPPTVVEEDPLPDPVPITEDDEAPPKLPKIQKDPVCQRCYRLTHYGKIESHLRVKPKRTFPLPRTSSLSDKTDIEKESSGDGLSELSPRKFRRTLERLRNVNAVIIFLVDIFDFHGTFIPSVEDIIGQKNPIILAVNKVDLLPKNYKASRVEGWIKHECSVMGLHDVAGIHLVSSTKGTGVGELVADALRIAKQRRSDVYVIGAANVGKSSFINRLMRIRKGKGNGSRSKDDGRPRRDKTSLGTITTSVVPGTTLDVIRIPLGGKVNLYDTPGLMISHQLTNFLDAKELRAVLPSKSVENVTFRLAEGKAIYIGGLARLEVVSGKPFFFTCFFAPTVKIHPGRADGAHEFLHRHVGDFLTPPFSEEGLEKLGEWTSKSFTAEGQSWKKSCVDIVLSGLGWISVTGPGKVRLRIWVPRGVGVFTREPLMPFETDVGVSKYTGSTAVNRKQMRKSSKKRKPDDFE